MAGSSTEGASVGLVEPPADPEAAGEPTRWPRHWPDRARLLERQHDRLEALLMELQREPATEHSGRQGPEALAHARACRRLLWDLRLHLRLEERWLAAEGCLCRGHQIAHQEARRRAMAGFMQSIGDPAARQHWLLTVQTWFLSHRQGPDALAYARAAACSAHTA